MNYQLLDGINIFQSCYSCSINILCVYKYVSTVVSFSHGASVKYCNTLYTWYNLL